MRSFGLLLHSYRKASGTLFMRGLIPSLKNSCATCNGIPASCYMPWSRVHKHSKELVLELIMRGVPHTSTGIGKKTPGYCWSPYPIPIKPSYDTIAGSTQATLLRDIRSSNTALGYRHPNGGSEGLPRDGWLAMRCARTTTVSPLSP